MEKQNSMKINQLPSKTWYWLGLNDTKVKWAAGAPCEICAEEPSADDEIMGFPEAMNTGAGKETDVLFAPEQTKNWSVSAKEGQTKQVTLSIGQGKETVSSGKIRAAAEEGASLTVFEVFEPAQAAGQLAVRTELYAKKDSRIRLVQVMMRGEGQELLNDVGCICEKNGALDLLQVVVGKGDVYDGIWTELQKDHASLQAEIGYLLQNQQKFDVNLNVRHFGKVTESTIQADGTLMDAAEKIFRGTIDFVRGSADSVGAETEQVLLLGDDVVNKTIPVILCAEENVQGSHGAAIGELDEETLFYFGARELIVENAVTAFDALVHHPLRKFGCQSKAFSRMTLYQRFFHDALRFSAAVHIGGVKIVHSGGKVRIDHFTDLLQIQFSVLLRKAHHAKS